MDGKGSRTQDVWRILSEGAKITGDNMRMRVQVPGVSASQGTGGGRGPFRQQAAGPRQEPEHLHPA